MTQKKKVYPDTRKHQEERKERNTRKETRLKRKLYQKRDRENTEVEEDNGQIELLMKPD